MDATGGKVTWILDAYEQPLLDGVDRAKKKVSEVADNADIVEARTNKAFDNIAKVGIGALVAASVAAGAAIVANIGNAVARVDTLNNAPKVLQNLGYSAEGSAKAIQNIADGIKGLPTRLDAAVSGLVAIASASGLGIDEATKLTQAFNNMALAGGKGSAEADRALVQFVQSLGRGKMGMQEFNTLSEVMPAQLAQVAKSLLGAGATSASLRDAFSEGTVTMDKFVQEIVKLDSQGGEGFASFSKQARDATSGIGTGWENLNAAIIRGISSIITAIGAGDISSSLASIGKAFEDGLKGVASFVNWIKENQDVLKAFAVALGVVTVAFIAFRAAIVVQDLMNVVTVARLGQGALVQYATTTKLAAGAQVLLNAAMSANPIGIIIVAIAAVVAALVYFFTQTETGKKIWEGFVKFLGEAWANITKFFKSAVDAIVVAWGNVVNWFKGVWDGIVAVFSVVGSFFKGIWDGVVGIFNGVVAFIREWGLTILAVMFWPFSLLLGLIIQNWDLIVAFFTTIATWFTEFFTGIWNGIVSIFTPIVQFYIDIFTMAWNGIVAIWGAVTAWFQSVWDGIVGIFNQVVGFYVGVFTAAWNGIMAIWNVVSGWFQGVWNNIVTVFTPVVNFFRDMFQKAWDAVVKVFSAVGGFFQGIWNTIVGLFTKVGTAVGDAVGGAFKSVINNVLKFVVGLINGFIDGINTVIGIINAIPGVKIGKLGKLPIPQLATGGIVTSETLAVIGEGSEPEAVLPLSKLDALLNNSNERDDYGSAREITINQTNEVYTELDMDQINRNLTWELNKI